MQLGETTKTMLPHELYIIQTQSEAKMKRQANLANALSRKISSRFNLSNDPDSV